MHTLVTQCHANAVLSQGHTALLSCADMICAVLTLPMVLFCSTEAGNAQNVQE